MSAVGARIPGGMSDSARLDCLAEAVRRRIDRQPGHHSDAEVDHPVGDVVNRLMAAEEQREQRGQGHLSTLVTQPGQPLTSTPAMTTTAMPAIPGPSSMPAGMARAAPSKNPATYWTPSRRERATVV